MNAAIKGRYHSMTSRPRVIICGTGQYGGLVARICEDVGYEVVGAYNRAGLKIGKDLGEVARLSRELGVTVEDFATADLTKLKADIAVVAQSNNLHMDLPTYQRLIEAGINVLSLAMEAYYPFGSDAETAAKIDALARQHQVTFSGSGIHDMTRIWSGILAAGQCTHLESIHHESLTNAAEQARPEQLLRDYAIDATVEEYQTKGFDRHRLWPVYTVALEHVLTALGYTVTEKHTRIEPIVWERDLDCPFLDRVIPAGRVLGTRTIGELKTREGVIGEVRTEGRVCGRDEQDYTLWRIEGKPRTEVYIKRLDPDYTNAACLVNRIKDVIAAPPGIVPIWMYGPTMGPELLARFRR